MNRSPFKSAVCLLLAYSLIMPEVVILSINSLFVLSICVFMEDLNIDYIKGFYCLLCIPSE